MLLSTFSLTTMAHRAPRPLDHPTLMHSQSTPLSSIARIRNKRCAVRLATHFSRAAGRTRPRRTRSKILSATLVRNGPPCLVCLRATAMPLQGKERCTTQAHRPLMMATKAGPRRSFPTPSGRKPETRARVRRTTSCMILSPRLRRRRCRRQLQVLRHTQPMR